MKNTRQIGTEKEQLCSHFLKKNNFIIKKTNYISQYGEIDIIAEKDDTIHFIEVKSNKNQSDILLYKLTSKKKSKIIKTALNYITKNNIIDKQINFIYMIVSNNKIRYYDNVIIIDPNKI